MRAGEVVHDACAPAWQRTLLQVSRRVNSIDIETGVIVGCIVAMIVGTAVWVYKYLALQAQQNADADAIRAGTK